MAAFRIVPAGDESIANGRIRLQNPTGRDAEIGDSHVYLCFSRIYPSADRQTCEGSPAILSSEQNGHEICVLQLTRFKSFASMT
jgi:hypothetical protein